MIDETLTRTLGGLRVGRPVSHGPLHLFPLRSVEPANEDLFLLLEEGLQIATLRVEELNEDGSVPELRVVNEGTLPVLILEGDELVGAKQNRVVNSSVLVAADSTLVLPVSCVERGRWSYRSRAFSSGPPVRTSRSVASRSKSVHDSLKRGRGHRGDQGAVWREVDRKARLHEAALAHPRTAGLALTPLGGTRRLRKARTRPTRRNQWRGVAIGERLMVLELLAGPRSFASAFRKLLSGYAFESLGLSEPYGTPTLWP